MAHKTLAPVLDEIQAAISNLSPVMLWKKDLDRWEIKIRAELSRLGYKKLGYRDCRDFHTKNQVCVATRGSFEELLNVSARTDGHGFNAAAAYLSQNYGIVIQLGEWQSSNHSWSFTVLDQSCQVAAGTIGPSYGFVFHYRGPSGFFHVIDNPARADHRELTPDQLGEKILRICKLSPLKLLGAASE